MVAALSSGWGMELAASGGKVVVAQLGRNGARSEPRRSRKSTSRR